MTGRLNDWADEAGDRPNGPPALCLNGQPDERPTGRTDSRVINCLQDEGKGT